MAGYYTDIVDIVAPSSAAAGETVLVTVSVENIWDYQFAMYIEALYDSELFYESSGDDWIYPGETLSFPCSFVMPDKDVTITVRSYYQDEDGYWHKDDEATKDVSLAAVPEPSFRGFGVREYVTV